MDIYQIMRAAADPQKAAPMKKYMRDKFPFFGLPTPVRRRVCQDFLKAKSAFLSVDWGFVNEAWGLDERECQYLAIDYLKMVKGRLTPKDLPEIEKIVLIKPWWDTIDDLSSVVGDIAYRHPAETRKTILAWSEHSSFWLRRLAIIHQLARQETTDRDLLERVILNNLGQTEFFINKAIGWSLRALGKTAPDWVRSFVERHGPKLAPLSLREATKRLN
ncbi:MAG: DNA alkylation repair protein [Deltaproteobacteria bacterium]|jgi:3-methyladenine DNA glycosylase AlkD|nr:DNA alkylation repair protein [Deltaproteobacteria bacterium]